MEANRAKGRFLSGYSIPPLGGMTDLELGRVADVLADAVAANTRAHHSKAAFVLWMQIKTLCSALGG
jgi:hypothetical protein